MTQWIRIREWVSMPAMKTIPACMQTAENLYGIGIFRWEEIKEDLFPTLTLNDVFLFIIN